MIKAIIFDCYGVLYVSKQHYFAQVVKRRHPEQLDQIVELEHQADYGLIDDTEFHQTVAKLTGMSLQEMARQVREDFMPNEPLIGYIRQLHARYKIALLTNLSINPLEKFFSGEALKELFDTVVISSHVGMVKPHPEIYQLTCERLGVDESEVIMIDNTPVNCDGAREAGLRAIVYRSFGQVKTDLERLL